MRSASTTGSPQASNCAACSACAPGSAKKSGNSWKPCASTAKNPPPLTQRPSSAPASKPNNSWRKPKKNGCPSRRPATRGRTPAPGSRPSATTSTGSPSSCTWQTPAHASPPRPRPFPDSLCSTGLIPPQSTLCACCSPQPPRNTPPALPASSSTAPSRKSSTGKNAEWSDDLRQAQLALEKLDPDAYEHACASLAETRAAAQARQAYQDAYATV